VETCCTHFRSGKTLLAMAVVEAQSKATFQVVQIARLEKLSLVTSAARRDARNGLNFSIRLFRIESETGGEASVRLDCQCLTGGPTASTLGKKKLKLLSVGAVGSKYLVPRYWAVP
jgi:hypothetical protein